MRYIINHCHDPFYNLALDEYALKHIDIGEDYFILWQNDPCVIIGKNQNALAQINSSFIDQQKIKVARRVSGGGAVYHDLGNLNFTFIHNVKDPSKIDFKNYVDPIVKALQSMDINAVAAGRNDILVDDLKISGNAQRLQKNRLMHHGTLLFDVDIDVMSQALTVNNDKFRSKAATSVKSRVVNIKSLLKQPMTVEQFQEKLHYYLSNDSKDEEIILTPQQIQDIKKLAEQRFSTWQWVYGESPLFNYQNQQRFTCGSIEVYAMVERGCIQSIRFLGDYLGVGDVCELENALQGIPYEKTHIHDVLSCFSLSHYFGAISLEELLSLIYI